MNVKDYKWWHRITLPDGTTTPGMCPHGVGEYNTRWGFPDSFAGKTVLDVGTYDGLFAFEAERRGAVVDAIDLEQSPLNPGRAGEPFKLAKKLLNSNVTYEKKDILDVNKQYDIVLFYGVLYHMDQPFSGLKKLAEITKEYALIETAASNRHEEYPMFELRPGHANDPTNFSYPNFAGIEAALKTFGFSKVEMVYNMGNRFTVKATK